MLKFVHDSTYKEKKTKTILSASKKNLTLKIQHDDTLKDRHSESYGPKGTRQLFLS